jgi:long-chain acyl-CoA synthetase
LAQGKYLSKIFVYGDSLKDTLVAIGVVEPEPFLKLAVEKKIDQPQESNLSELVKNSVLLDAVLADLTQVAKSLKLKGFEIPKKIYLTEKEFDTVDGLTPTMKLKRNVLKKVFQKQIDEMYQSIESK